MSTAVATNIYLLDWHDSAHAAQPKPQEVANWLAANGYTTDAAPKVYANGTVQVSCDRDPTAEWRSFVPVAPTVQDDLSWRITELLEARKAIAGGKTAGNLSSVERGLLACIDLLAYGYGVKL